MKRVSVVVLNYNKRPYLEAHLARLLEQDVEQQLELIVVDNRSSDGSVEFLQQLRERFDFELVLNERNEGVGGGRNSGFRRVTTDYVVYLDDDVGIDVSTALSVVDHFAAHPRAGILAFRIHDVHKGPLTDHGSEAKVVANFGGAAYAFRAALLEQVGYLDDLCTFGGEELDWSVRAHAQGWETVFIPELLALHHSAPVQETEQKRRRDRWAYNFARLLAKNFPLRVSLPWIARYSATNVFYATRAHGTMEGARVTVAAVQGVADGFRNRSVVPPVTQRFYSDSELRPDFGNVPFLRKALRRLRGPSR